MTRIRTALLVAALLAVAVFTVAASAGKPGNGASTGQGRVFFPNPVATLQDQSLTDQKDEDYAALQPAYRDVTLTNLDGSGTLSGDYANIRNETGDNAYSATNQFLYGRSDDRFEQVMGYYWVTETQKYFQALGFGTGKRFAPVNEESQDLRINQWGADNSYSWDKHDIIRMGKGGVDDAEDAEVIVHEYGHAVHDAQRVDLQGVEAGGIGEGFGDYLAVTVTNYISPTPDAPCVADWDAVSYTSTVPHCLRRIDTAAHYPESLSATSVHRNGLIWSASLWDIQKAIGRVAADTTILEAHFSMGVVTNMPSAAGVIVDTAKRLYGDAVAAQVRGAFEARGVLG
ncbi:MAG TPA: M36 family metallopeptidase [Gaiellaceae bacterium]|nr:M36 family metallopeptidase [Gaiellaceae bacterium]